MALRILAVDDFEPWRRFVSSALDRQLGLQTLLEASDGLEAVYRAAALRPDLILLDIGLPTLDGIKAARRIRDLSPNSKILFLSEESSPEVAEAALAAGGSGYIVKSDAGRELSAAVDAVIEGKRYISAKLVGHVFFDFPDAYPSQVRNFHELQMYSSDASFLDGFTAFIAGVLNAGNAVIVLASEAHRQALLQKLQTRGFDLDAVINSGSYISMDAGDFLSSLMVGDQPDPNQLEKVLSSVLEQAAKAPNGATRRVFACGECAPFLWTQGKANAALRVEELWAAVSQKYQVSTLCGYISVDLQEEEQQRVFQAIRSVHSAVIPCDHTHR
jgi:DNA-binding NarL/FixJ family response regulator